MCVFIIAKLYLSAASTASAVIYDIEFSAA